MTRGPMDPLVRVSRLMLEMKLAEVQRKGQAREESRARLADLARSATDSDLPMTAMQQASLRYERWAEALRAEINLTLARQTAEWMEAQDAARHAFGRAEALRRLAEKR